ncbi:hypothetical protein F4780DRAFT_789440 [Xylariomycetidae sp. FL0641]|nr:hypothetical protein F4780DRAFT_789440 [Xylariomycetidae sp. FL0641]
MAAFVSFSQCKSYYNATLDCRVTDGQNKTIQKFDYEWAKTPNVTIGDYTRGTFPGDPDIAGVGVLGSFVAVTSAALALSTADVIWQIHKTHRRERRTEEREKAANPARNSVSDILETLVLACSDQQVFTGGAYALTLRYWQGCSISSYHYNVIGQMLLLTCATHLMSVTIVRNYWRYPFLAFIRIVAISLLFIATGLVFVNQNADNALKFPTGVPKADQFNSLLFLPAACFESSTPEAARTFQQTTKSGKDFFQTLSDSTPDNTIQGWNWYVVILLFYAAALITETVRFFRRARSRKGWRAAVGKRLHGWFPAGSKQNTFFAWVFLIYLIGGIGISFTVVIKTASYIFKLRSWVANSGWIQLDNNQNPENIATTFGQLVPLFSTALIVFSLAQILSEKLTKRGNRKHADEDAPPQEGAIQYLDPSTYDLMSPPEKRTTEYFGAAGVAGAGGGGSTPPPPRIGLDHHQSSSWSSRLTVPVPNASEAAAAHSPLLHAAGNPDTIAPAPTAAKPDLPHAAGRPSDPVVYGVPPPRLGSTTNFASRTSPPARPLGGSSPSPSLQAERKPAGPSRSSTLASSPG